MEKKFTRSLTFILIVFFLVVATNFFSLATTATFTGTILKKEIKSSKPHYVVSVDRTISGPGNLSSSVIVRDYSPVVFCQNPPQVDSNLSRGDKVRVRGEVKKLTVVDLTCGPYYMKKIDESTGNQGEGLRVRISMDQSSYRIGEKGKINLYFSRDVRFTLIENNSNGRKILFRNKRASAGRHSISGNIERPAGRKSMKVIAQDQYGNRASDTVHYRVGETNEEPTARCSSSPDRPKVGERVTFSASNSYDSDGHIDSYRWDFDDYSDTDDYGETVYHTFNESGYQKVELEVEDNDGATDSTTCSVRVEEENDPPTARCSVSPSEATVGESVNFDASDSYDSDGYVDNYRWDFDRDGNTDSYSEWASNEFHNSGYKRVKLEVEDNDGETDTTTCGVRIKEKKGKLEVIVRDRSGEKLDANVYLDGNYRGDTGYDGVKEIDELEPARYRVKATKSGYNEDQGYVYIDPGEDKRVTLKLKRKNQPPNAKFSYSPAKPERGEKVSFDASNSSDSDGNIVIYGWDFDGDGNTESYGEKPNHVFFSAGRYTVKLTVADNNGAEDSATHEITVEEKERETELVIKEMEVLGKGADPKEFKPKDMLRIRTELKNQGPIAVDDPSCKLIFPSLGKTLDENFPYLPERSTKTKTVNWLIPEDVSGGKHQGQIICSGDSSEGTVKAAADDIPKFKIVTEPDLSTLRLARGEKLTGSYDPGDQVETKVLLENDGHVSIDRSLSCDFLVFEPASIKLEGGLEDISLDEVEPDGKVLVPLRGKLPSSLEGGSHQGEGTLICKGSSSEGKVIPYTGELGYDYKTSKQSPRPELAMISVDTLIFGKTGLIYGKSESGYETYGAKGGYVRLKLVNAGGKATGGIVEVDLPEVLEITEETPSGAEKQKEEGRKKVRWDLEEGMDTGSETEYFIKVKRPGPGVLGEVKKSLFGSNANTSDLQANIQVKLEDSEASKRASESVDIGLIEPTRMADLADERRKVVENFHEGFAEGILKGKPELLTTTTREVTDILDSGNLGEMWTSGIANLSLGLSYPTGLSAGLGMIEMTTELMNSLKETLEKFIKSTDPLYAIDDQGRLTKSCLKAAESTLDSLKDHLEQEAEAWKTRDRDVIEDALESTKSTTGVAIRTLEEVREVNETEEQKIISDYADEAITWLQEDEELTSELLDALRGDRHKWM